LICSKHFDHHYYHHPAFEEWIEMILDGDVTVTREEEPLVAHGEQQIVDVTPWYIFSR
jgi:hypothetical protein